MKLDPILWKQFSLEVLYRVQLIKWRIEQIALWYIHASWGTDHLILFPESVWQVPVSLSLWANCDIFPVVPTTACSISKIWLIWLQMKAYTTVMLSHPTVWFVLHIYTQACTHCQLPALSPEGPREASLGKGRVFQPCVSIQLYSPPEVSCLPLQKHARLSEHERKCVPFIKYAYYKCAPSIIDGFSFDSIQLLRHSLVPMRVRWFE